MDRMRYTTCMKNKLIVFDLDGVLFDSIELMHEYTESRFEHIPRHAVVELHAGDVDFSDIKSGEWVKKPETPEGIEARLKEYREKKLAVLMYPKMKDLVMQLAEQATLVVNTSAATEASLPLLERERIDDLFALVATRDLHESKAEKFKLIAETFKVAPQEILFITDSLGDIRQAAIHSVPTIAVTWGVHDRSFFEREPHAHLVAIVGTVEELAQTLQSKF